MTESQAMIRRLELPWFAAGLGTAVFLLVTQAWAVGGWAGLLQLGIDDPLRPLLEAQLGSVPASNLGSHDGPLYYAIGLDPAGHSVIPLLDLPGLRYRRILYPIAASLGGVFDGWALLLGMLTVTSVAVGIASASLRSILRHFELPVWAMVGVLANPGVWFGVRILTPDPLGLGLGLLGLALGLRKRYLPAALALAAAGFAKEPFLLFGVGLAGWLWLQHLRRPAGTVMALSTVPLFLWGLFVDRRAGDGLSPTGNFSLPFAGIWHSASLEWPMVRESDLIMSGVTLAVVIAGLLLPVITRWSFLAWQAVPWSLVAIITSHWVWNYGNASIRAFAPLWTFTILGVAAWWQLRRSPHARKTLDQTRMAIPASRLSSR